MPHLPGVVSAGAPEATRLSQALIHRGAEVGIVAAAGERADRIRAERLPEAGEGRAIGHRPGRERRQGRRGRRQATAPPPDAERPSGGLVDLQA
jgi:hypothetical protein